MEQITIDCPFPAPSLLAIDPLSLSPHHAILVIVPTLIIALYFLQSRLIYIPQFPPGSRTVVWKPDRFGFRRWKEEYLLARDGTKLHMYWIEGRGDWSGGVSNDPLFPCKEKHLITRPMQEIWDTGCP